MNYKYRYLEFYRSETFAVVLKFTITVDEVFGVHHLQELKLFLDFFVESPWILILLSPFIFTHYSVNQQMHKHKLLYSFISVYVFPYTCFGP
jgi:hypothetical protein